MIQKDYVERCYAGWLGKLIGVRFGAAIEGWNYEHIRKVYGKLETYIDTYDKLFAADDDTNAPLALLSALYDFTPTEEITPQQIALGLLNHAPYEHGFFWWGGYGKSTEHTAYTNLREGIPAPLSGSVEHNGAAVAEQIGGQIFIDPWGLIAPGNPALAARYAAKAASVTHGGNGVYGGMFVAAAIAAAFAGDNIRKVLETALAQIPPDCEYTRVVKDMFAFYDNDAAKDWETAFAYIKKNWGYDRYPGVCHIIPNSAVMVMSMLYGNGDFSKTICICNMCGWDTDCNVGNVATIMGVLKGLEGIEMRWRNRINDAFAGSTVIGFRNFLDAPWCAAYMATLGYRIAGEGIPERWAPFFDTAKIHYHFEFPGSTHGFRAYADTSRKDGEMDLRLSQTSEDAASGSGSLKISAASLTSGDKFRIARRTHHRPEDFHNSRYDPAFSPLVYPGQHLEAKVKQFYTTCKCTASLYALDANNKKVLQGEEIALGNEWTTLGFDIPAGSDICIDEIGVSVFIDEGWNAQAVVLVDDFIVSGKAGYGIDFSKERVEYWNRLYRPISQFTFLRGIWSLEGDHMVGVSPAYAETYTGNINWQDIDFSSEVLPLCMPGKNARAGIGFRIQGAMRSYCAALEDGKIKLLKNENGVYKSLAETPLTYKIGEAVRLRVLCKGPEIKIFHDGKAVLEYSDKDHPYLSGCIGAILANGSRAAYSRWAVKAE
jgi:ADP-ribosylglycohydrolase